MQILLHTSLVATEATVWLLAKNQPLPEVAEVAQGDFTGDRNETLLVYGADGHKHFLLGLGEKPTPDTYLKAVRKLFFSQKAKLPTRVGIDLTGALAGDSLAEQIESIGLGVLGGGYDLKLYQTGKTEPAGFYGESGTLHLTVTQADFTAAQRAIDRAMVIGSAQRAMLDLANAPSNYKTPQTLADWAVASGRAHGYSVTIIDHDELARQGYNALLSVGQGSENPPLLIICDYNPSQATGLTVGLVGKGVTFDTGGISIKPSTNMHLMKSDMGGAAAVLGTLEVAARLRLPMRVVGIVPATENVVDGMATKPGDVITSYLGKTIEIIDTDAEGRVILADGLGHMVRHIQPDVLIDLATLTGNVIAALGYQAGGLFTNNDELSAQLLAAGDQTGERLWRLPLWDAYKDDLTSDVADVKNFSGKPINGAIAAAKFLEVFTDKHPRWAHLDIAGMAFADTEFGQQKNATAYGIRLLVAFLEGLVQSAAAD